MRIHANRLAAAALAAATGLVLRVDLAGPPPAAAGPGDPPVTAPPAEAAARATLDRWLAAQNAGRFADYAALYAPAFAGVKRVGRTAKKMNRAAWLKDRKAMFRAPMKVGAADVKVTLPPPGATTGAILEFTQTWASGTFADTGPKRIVLDAAGAQIVAEELVSSRPMLTGAACLTALYPGASVAKKLTAADDGARPVRDLGVRDLGSRWLCQVTVEREGGYEVALGAFVFDKKWALHGRLDLDYDEAAGADDGDDSTSGEVTALPLALHATIPVVQVTVERRRSGNEYGERRVETALYRVDGDAFEELLSWESGGTTGEADDVKECDLAVGSRRTRGWPDLTLTCTTRQVEWAAGEQEPRESREVTRYRWDGSTYAEP